MPVFEIKNWDGGISPFSDRGVRGSFKFGSNLDIRKLTDTLSAGQALQDEGLLGGTHSMSASLSQSPSLSPSASNSPSPSPSNSPSRSASPSPSASRSASKSASPSSSASPSASVSASLSPSAGLNNVFVDLIHFFVKATDGNTYGFGNAGNIYRRYSDGYTRNVYKDPDGEIKGAEEKPSSSGTTYLIWATDTKIKRKPLPGRSDWQDVETIASNLTGSDWHTMKQIGGGVMIANKSFIAFVGYDDSVSNEILDIIPGRIAKTLVERNGRVVIGTYKTGFPNKGANGAIDCEYPLVQTGTDGEIYYADFSSSVPIRKFPGGGRVNPGGVANEMDQVEMFDFEEGSPSWIDKQTLGNMSLWGIFDADSGKNGVYTFGRRNKEQSFTLNLEYELDVDEIGAVTNVEGTTIISYRDGTDFGVKAVDPDTKATATYESLEFRAPIKKPINITTWEYTELFFDPMPAGCSIKYYYKLNHDSSWTQAMLSDGSNAFTIAGGTEAVFRINAQGNIFEQKIELIPSNNNTPEVTRAKTYFQ